MVCNENLQKYENSEDGKRHDTNQAFLEAYSKLCQVF